MIVAKCIRPRNVVVLLTRRCITGMTTCLGRVYFGKVHEIISEAAMAESKLNNLQFDNRGTLPLLLLLFLLYHHHFCLENQSFLGSWQFFLHSVFPSHIRCTAPHTYHRRQ